jgi:hypothetical protein
VYVGEVLGQLTGTAGGSVTQTDVLSLLTQWGPLGLVLLLVLLGVLVPKPMVDLLRQQLERAQQAHDLEREAHAKTREALSQQAARGEAAVQAAQTAQRLLERLSSSGTVSERLGPP